MQTTRPSAASGGSTEVREDKPALKRRQTNHVLQGQTYMPMGICDCKTAGPGNSLSEVRRQLTLFVADSLSYLTASLDFYVGK